MAVKVACHEDASAALISGTFAPQPVDFSVLVDLHTVQTVELNSAFSSWKQHIDGMQLQLCCSNPLYLVVFEHSQLDLLPLVLILLGGGVRLLLPLLSTTTQPQHQVQRGLLGTRTSVRRQI